MVGDSSTKIFRTKIFPHSSQHSGDRVSLFIVLITSSVAALLPLLSRLVSRTTTTTSSYQGFVVCIMFAFSSALSAVLLVSTKPKVARVFRSAAIVCLSSALLLFISTLFFNCLP